MDGDAREDDSGNDGVCDTILDHVSRSRGDV